MKRIWIALYICSFFLGTMTVNASQFVSDFSTVEVRGEWNKVSLEERHEQAIREAQNEKNGSQVVSIAPEKVYTGQLSKGNILSRVRTN